MVVQCRINSGKQRRPQISRDAQTRTNQKIDNYFKLDRSGVQCRINSGKLRRPEKISLDAQSRKKQKIDNDIKFDGSEIVRKIRKISQSTSTPATATPPVSVKGCTADVPLSPRKALRAAMLKKRFADISFDAKLVNVQTGKKQKIDNYIKFDGSGIVRNEEKGKISLSTSTLATATPPVSVKGCVADVPLSPRKALRAAMLKKRFADTIFKAKLVNGDESDVSRTEVRTKAGEAALRRKAQYSLKMSRDRERKAARLALQKMKNTADFGNFKSILKDLEILSGMPANMGYPNASRLTELTGLRMKKDIYLEEDEDIEEGEIR